MPTYNGARFLKAAIDSCLAQTYTNIELIIVDDGSTDETPAVLASYNDARLRVKRTENQGLPSALNEGFEMATGRYWTWTSDDNVFLSNAIEEMLRFSKSTDASHVCADFLVVDESGTVCGYNNTGWACFLYSADAARTVGKYRPEYTLVEDADFFLRLQFHYGPFQRYPHPLYLYRTHSGSLSAKSAATRALISLRLHLQHWHEGMVTCENYNLRRLFSSRLRMLAMAGNIKGCEEVLAIATEARMPFADTLRAEADLFSHPLPRFFLLLQAKLASLQQKITFLIIHRKKIPWGNLPKPA